MFQEYGINITLAQAREPMGLPKIEHIKQILQNSDVSEQFLAKYGRAWEQKDLVEMNSKFESFLFATLHNFATPMPNVIQTLNQQRAQGIKIGSTTGYTQAMMQIVRQCAAEQGYVVDNLVTPNDVPAGRPAPYMIYRNMIDLAIDSVDKVVKVGDTIADIREGVAANVWSVGIIEGSSELGLTQSELENMPIEKLTALKASVRNRMIEAGANFVLNSIADLPACIERINTELKNK